MKLVLQVAYDPPLGEERARLMVEAGFQVVTAHTNIEAQAACGEHRFDAIILGYASPLPNRKTMLEWLQEHCPGVPIISLYSRQFLPVPKAAYVADGEQPEAWLSVLKGGLARAAGPGVGP